jgi:predicted outer membrane repeat protein
VPTGGGDGFYDFYTAYSGLGGAVYVGTGCNPEFIDCTFTNNSCEGGLCGITGLDGEPAEGRSEPGLRWKIDSFGAAVFCADNSSAVFKNCTFSDNFTDPNRPIRDQNLPYDPVSNYDNDDIFVGFGGAVAFKDNANVTFDNCTFTDNAADKGGAIYCTDSDPQINDCNFVDNSAQSGGGILFAGGFGRIARSNFVGNEASGDIGRGGGICSLGANALIFDCNISDNIAAESGGGIYISSKDADGNDLVVDGNTVFGYNKAVLLNCLITGNLAGVDGGGVSANWDSEPEIINCTIADNIVTGAGYGGGVYGSYGSYTNIVDSIIWGNSANFGPQIGIGITVSPSTMEVSYSDVQGAQSDAYVEEDCSLIWDPNNLYTNPFFVIGPLGDYYLSQTDVNDPAQTVDSPCVDAGSGSAIGVGMSGYTTRTDEVFDRGIVDMGYHHLSSLEVEKCRVADLLFDHIINFGDEAMFALNWLRDDCNENNDWCNDADFTFDGDVDFEDMGFLFECWLVGDTEPPVPNPSEWAVEPYSSSTSPPYSISMTAETSVDNWGGDVEYYFECVYGNCNDSGWQNDPNYTDDANGFSLDPNTEYGYRVRARDGYPLVPVGDLTGQPGNKTDWSVIRYAISGGGEEPPPPPDTTPPSPDPMTWAVYPHATSSTTIAMTATTATDDISDVKYYFEDVTTPSSNSGWIDVPTWTDVGLTPDTAYIYSVRARDTSPLQNVTGWSDPCSATTLEEGAEPNDPNIPEPPPQAPVIVGAIQVETGFYWHHIITALATTEDPLNLRFVCLDEPGISSEWVPRDGNAVDTYPPLVPGDLTTAPTITRGSGVITYNVAVGVSWNTWRWQVCGSNDANDYDPVSCSDPCAMPPPPPW